MGDVDWKVVLLMLLLLLMLLKGGKGLTPIDYGPVANRSSRRGTCAGKYHVRVESSGGGGGAATAKAQHSPARWPADRVAIKIMTWQFP